MNCWCRRPGAPVPKVTISLRQLRWTRTPARAVCRIARASSLATAAVYPSYARFVTIQKARNARAVRRYQ